MFKSALALGTTLALLTAATVSAETLRVMTYNILNYNSGRTTEFRTAIEDTDPDIIVVEEVLSQSGVNNWLNSVLEHHWPGEFSSGRFVNGPDTDNGIYYRTAKVDSIDHRVISTALRDIDEWTLRPVGYTTSAADLRFYAVHLKASSGSTNEQKRLAEVTLMRAVMETYPAGGNYMVIGDFNIYNSFEPAYGYMLSAANGPAGVVVDPINRPGGWHHGPAFASIHTQSPRTTQFGGGANGGMDDRFDIILTAPSFLDGHGYEYIPDTYTAYGQDGLHYNIALTDPPANGVVSAEVAQALHDASDHLPVYADFRLPAILLADGSLNLGTAIVGGASSLDLSVANVAASDCDALDYTLTAPTGFTAPVGPFVAVGGDPANVHLVELDTSVAGAFAADLIIDSDAIDSPTFPVALTGTVLDHAAPSVVAGIVQTTIVVDFGTHAVGDFTDQTIEAHNVDYGSLQALLDVYDDDLTGDPGYSVVGGFAPATVGDTPGTWTINFNDTGATDGVYTGTIVLLTRDQPDLSGATELSSLTFELTATVDSGVVTTPESPTILAGIQRVFPNPFRPRTTIGYGLTEAGLVELNVFDVAGRRVRALVNATLGRGLYEVRWDGRDDASHDVGPGIYYLRLETPTSRETQRVVRIR